MSTEKKPEWEEGLTGSIRYRVEQEEMKYNNKPSREMGVNWLEQVTNKLVPDLVKKIKQIEKKAEESQRILCLLLIAELLPIKSKGENFIRKSEAFKAISNLKP